MIITRSSATRDVASGEKTPDQNEAQHETLVRATFVMALLLGAFVRFYPGVTGGFPPNDGGLFIDMANAVADNGFRLPKFVIYNGQPLPFAYPPLSFYLAALFKVLFGLNPIDFMRFFAPLCSTATIAAFWFFVYEMSRSRRMASIGALVLALSPTSYIWPIMGGGLTRAPGYLFATLALALFLRAMRRDEWRSTFICGAFAALTFLFHAEMAKFVVCSAALMWVCFGKNVRTAAKAVTVTAIAMVLSAPWWIATLSYHGLAPYRAAAATGQEGWRSIYAWSNSTAELAWPLLFLCMIVGGVVLLYRRNYFVPLWPIYLLVVQPRSYRTLAALSVSFMLAAFIDFVLTSRPDMRLVHSRLRRSAAVLLMVYSFLGCYAISVVVLPNSVLRPDELSLMNWAKSKTPAHARFLILPYAIWANDSYSEWFPTIARRTSVATVQGTEWLPNRAFYKSWTRADVLRKCRDKGAACVSQWTGASDIQYDYILLPKPTLDESSDARNYWKKCEADLRTSPQWKVIYDQSGGLIFQRK